MGLDVEGVALRVTSVGDQHARCWGSNLIYPNARLAEPLTHYRDMVNHERQPRLVTYVSCFSAGVKDKVRPAGLQAHEILSSKISRFHRQNDW